MTKCTTNFSLLYRIKFDNFCENEFEAIEVVRSVLNFLPMMWVKVERLQNDAVLATFHNLTD